MKDLIVWTCARCERQSAAYPGGRPKGWVGSFGAAVCRVCCRDGVEVSEPIIRWICEDCGRIHEGTEARPEGWGGFADDALCPECLARATDIGP